MNKTDFANAMAEAQLAYGNKLSEETYEIYWQNLQHCDGEQVLGLLRKHIEEERFGNSILTRFPMRKSRGRGLHHYKEGRSRRGALWVEIDVEERISLQLITAHLSLYPKEQLLQATELVDQWIKPASQHGPIVLCGDFNARPNNPAYKAINQVLWDVESFDEQIRPAGTYFSPRPVARLDHIFVSGGLQVKNCQVISTRLAKSASDHLPLMTDLRIPDSPPDQLLKNENVLMR